MANYTAETLVGKNVLMGNGRVAIVRKYVRNEKYCFHGEDLANGREVKWTKSGFGNTPRTNIHTVDPDTIITKAGMYVTDDGCKILIQPNKNNTNNSAYPWIGTDENGHFDSYNSYGYGGEDTITGPADMIDNNGGIFFTSYYLVCIEPGSVRTIDEVKSFLGKAMSPYKKEYYWNADGKPSAGQKFPSPVGSKFEIISKFIPLYRKGVMRKTNGFQFTGPGRFLTRNDSEVRIEGQAPQSDMWYGYVNSDKTNHHVWDKFGRVFIEKYGRWIIGTPNEDLDIVSAWPSDDFDPMEGDDTSKLPAKGTSMSETFGGALKREPLNFAVNELYQTSWGLKILILEIDAANNNDMIGYVYDEKRVLAFHNDGSAIGMPPHVLNTYNITDKWVEPKSGTVWVNVYLKNGSETEIGEVTAYHNPKAAQAEAAIAANKRMACVKVEWKEGQFDGEESGEIKE